MGLSRLQKLRQRLIDLKLDAILICYPENRLYLSGFSGSTGWLLVSESHAILAVDFRYIERAKQETSDFEIIQVRGEITKWLPDLAAERGCKKLGFEANKTSFAVHHQLREVLRSNRYQIKLTPTTNLVESIRSIKEPEEIAYITAAVELADSAIDHSRSILHDGMTEKDMAWELERFLREHGSESIPFDIIVASGPNSALPHAKSSDRIIQHNEPIIIDIGAKVNGYCSDLSRTLCLGNTDNQFSKIYDITLGAQLTALSTVETGMNGDQADHLARVVIEEANYGSSFGHGLGHGVGLEAHELPRLGPNSPDLLADGMVFTIEPGIYILGWGGVRIEDTVLLENGKLKVLAKANKIANI